MLNSREYFYDRSPMELPILDFTVDHDALSFTPNLFAYQSQPDLLPEETFVRVKEILSSAHLFRYSAPSAEASEVALLEKAMADYLGVRYALAVNSASSAIFLALAAHGVLPGDQVLTSAFTFTAVPGAIMHAHASPVLVESDLDCHLDLEDLRCRITPETQVLVVSHMRGHVSDMDAILDICRANKIFLVEDAAHSLGVRWGEQMTGTIGDAGCFSFQSNKIINAGEGGLLVSNDEEFMVRAVLLSGAFEDSWKKHFIDSQYFETYARRLPKYNFRMNNLSAAIVRSQIGLITAKQERYLRNHLQLAQGLADCPEIEIPKRLPKEHSAPNTMQFRLTGMNEVQKLRFSDLLREKGISNAIFGLEPGNARAYWNWEYLGLGPEDYPRTAELLRSVCDLRTPYFWGEGEIQYVIRSILDAVLAVRS